MRVNSLEELSTLRFGKRKGLQIAAPGPKSDHERTARLWCFGALVLWCFGARWRFSRSPEPSMDVKMKRSFPREQVFVQHLCSKSLDEGVFDGSGSLLHPLITCRALPPRRVHATETEHSQARHATIATIFRLAHQAPHTVS